MARQHTSPFVLGALPLLLSGCLLGVALENEGPTLIEAQLVEPSFVLTEERSGLPLAREGTEVVVRIATASALGLPQAGAEAEAPASRITLYGAELTCTEGAPQHSDRDDDPDAAGPRTGTPVEGDTQGYLYVCRRTLDGTERNGPKGLSGTLADVYGRTSNLDTSPLFFADFDPPTAACVLSPNPANARHAVTLVVTPSEELAAPPEVSGSLPQIQAAFDRTEAGQHHYTVTAEPGLNVDGYTLTLTATDRAGNPQQDVSLCEASSRTGSILGAGPSLAAEPALEATPSVTIDGVPWVRAGAVLTVSLPTEAPIDSSASSASLSGVPLVHTAGTHDWSVTLDGTEGDGLKKLDAVLVDGAGNTLRLQRAGVVRFDFTPPSATCILSPKAANAEQAVTFALVPNEPLLAAPVLTSSEVALGAPSDDGRRWVSSIAAPGNADTSYTIRVAATDRVGNSVTDDDLCPEADRTGVVLGVVPALLDVPLVDVIEGPHLDDTSPVRIGTSAVVEVSFTTARPIDPALSQVQLGDLPLAWNPATLTWRAEVDPGATDGRKQLSLVLVDEVGNTARPCAEGAAPSWCRDDVRAVVVDQTPPEVASAALQRTPFFGPAEDGSGTVRFCSRDPVTKEEVRAALRVTSTERLDRAPSLEVHGPSSPSWTLTESTERTGNWVQDVMPSPDGTYTFTVTLVDELGNGSEALPLDAVMVVDTVGPLETPAVNTPDKVVFHRQPWGDTSMLSTPSYRVVGGAGAVAARATVMLETATGSVLASTRADAEGAFSLVTGVDHGRLYVRQLDEAGAAGPAALVRDVAWTASMGNKVLGSSIENPNTLELAPAAGVTLRQVHGFNHEQASANQEVRGSAPWIPWDGNSPSTDGAPEARYEHAMAYDLARGVAVMFGGGSSSGLKSDTWEWQRSAWRLRSSSQAPPARNDHALAYDAARGVTVLFGGSVSGGGRLADTWEWDGTTWTRVNPPTSPSARSDHALAYDAARGVTVLFGGYDGARRSDTWEWDGKTWTSRDIAGSPPARSGHGMAYDVARGVTVLVGGYGDTYLTDTWEYDGVRWVLRPTEVAPSGRSGHYMTYDVARGVTIVVGGRCGANCDASSLWEWDGTVWTRPTTDGPLPFARHDSAMVYDPLSETTFLFGGWHSDQANGWLNDTWRWDGSDWLPLLPLAPGPSRARHTLTYDASRGVSVLFGGTNWPEDTWEWDGSSWTSATVEAPPVGRTRHAAVYDSERQLTMIVGGQQVFPRPDVWTWDGEQWFEEPGLPANNFGHSLAYDSVRGVSVLFGGVDDWSGLLDITMEFDGTSWRSMNPRVSPSGREGAGLEFDRARGTTLLFGGFDGSYKADTWTWNGAKWTRLNPQRSPPARYSPVMAYDEARDLVILVGGSDGTGTYADLWEWDGVTWTERHPAVLPPVRYGEGFTFDERQNSLVLHGGIGNAGLLSDTWTLSPDSPLFLQVQMSVPFAFADAPQATITGATVRWVAGATGHVGETEVDGAQLLVWSGRGWKPVHEHALGPDAPSTLCAVLVASASSLPEPDCVEVVDPALLGQVFRFGANLTGTFAIRPVGPIGMGDSRLRSSDVAVTVRYRLPSDVVGCEDADTDGRCDGFDL